jgi:hypothetical protein
LVVSDVPVGVGPAKAMQPLYGNSVRCAEELLEDGDARAARQVVEEALNAGGSHSDLLWVLADVEFADGDLMAGRSRLDEAADACGRDAAATGRQIRVLYRNGLWREALFAVESIPADLREDPSVRTEVGGFYRGCGCYAHATDGYGCRDGLPRRSRAARRWCWWRSGGPSGRIRRRALTWEESALLSWLRRRIGFADQLDAVPGLEDREVLRLRSQIETLEYRRRLLFAVPRAVARVLYRLLPVAGLLVWLVLFVIIHQVHFLSGPGGAAAGTALSAAVATVLVVALAYAFVRPDIRSRFKLRITIRTGAASFFVVVVFETAVAEGYDRHALPAVGWWSWTVLGLAAVPAILVGGLLVSVIMNRIYWMRLSRLIREDCLVAVLDMLLTVLDELRAPPRSRQLAQRLKCAWTLEFAARRLTRDLLPAYYVDYVGSGDWLTRRAAGWAEALRHMQRQVVAPVPESQAKAEAALMHEIRCLAIGDLGALAWRKPPPRPPRRTVLLRHAITAIRTILVATLPLAAVLATQPFLHTSPGLFGWARIATAAWALLYLVLSLDPAIRDKIDTASQVAGILHNARSSS